MEKREHPYTVGRYAQWCSCYENSMEVSPETKTRVAIESSNPTPGYIPRQNFNSKRYVHPCVHSSTIYNSQNMETS